MYAPPDSDDKNDVVKSCQFQNDELIFYFCVFFI